MAFVTDTLTAIAAWLEHSPLNALIVGAAWIIPAVQVVHILAVAFTLAAVVIVNLRVVGLVETSQPIAAVADRFLPTLPIALAILALSGLLLIAGEPTRAMFRYVFWLKMAMITLACALAWSIGRTLRAGKVPASRLSLLSVRAQAVVSTFLWLAVIVAGRWIGYTNGWPGSPQ